MYDYVHLLVSVNILFVSDGILKKAKESFNSFRFNSGKNLETLFLLVLMPRLF